MIVDQNLKTRGILLIYKKNFRKKLVLSIISCAKGEPYTSQDTTVNSNFDE